MFPQDHGDNQFGSQIEETDNSTPRGAADPDLPIAVATDMDAPIETDTATLRDTIGRGRHAVANQPLGERGMEAATYRVLDKAAERIAEERTDLGGAHTTRRIEPNHTKIDTGRMRPS